VKIPWIEQTSKRSKWLIGVSGGLDSMALLHLLHEAGFKKLVVCHLNHGLRGKESETDSRFVKRVSERLGYEVIAAKIDLQKHMEQNGESLETAGRMARHEFFANCARMHRCNRLLLAHHADDQAETVLWNLMRGSLGCRGMNMISNLRMDGKQIAVTRPLLNVRKVELADWMRLVRLTWREDASNAVNDVVRNRLRNEAIPLLNKISNRDVTPSLNRIAELDSNWRELLDWSTEAANVLDPQGRLHAKALLDLPDILKKAVISAYLKARGIVGINQDLLSRCVNLLDVTQPASLNLPGGERLRRRAGRVFVEQKS